MLVQQLDHLKQPLPPVSQTAAITMPVMSTNHHSAADWLSNLQLQKHSHQHPKPILCHKPLSSLTCCKHSYPGAAWQWRSLLLVHPRQGDPLHGFLGPPCHPPQSALVGHLLSCPLKLFAWVAAKVSCVPCAVLQRASKVAYALSLKVALK